MSIVPKKNGRPRLENNIKKIKVTTNVTPDLMIKLENDVQNGNGANVSNLIFQIVKKYYAKK